MPVAVQCLCGLGHFGIRILLFRFRRSTHVTPKSFLSFVDIYKSVYKSKVAIIADLADRMKLGLEKLIEAGESVEKLSKDLVFKERDLAVASGKAEKVSIGNILDHAVLQSGNPQKSVSKPDFSKSGTIVLLCSTFI